MNTITCELGSVSYKTRNSPLLSEGIMIFPSDGESPPFFFESPHKSSLLLKGSSQQA